MDPHYDDLPLGPLELFLLRENHSIVKCLTSYFDLHDFFSLGKLNQTLRYWFEAHCRKVWDFTEFARIFCHRPKKLLSFLDRRHALIYGEAVLQFFLRGSTVERTRNLEICATIDRFADIQGFLHEEGYVCPALQPVLEHWPANVQMGDLIRRRHRHKSMTWSLDSDQSSRPEDLDGFVYAFYKGPLNRRKAILLHIIRCEPHRHVLSRSNTIFTCFMSGDAAYCSFANSLLIHKKGFVLDGQRWKDEWHETDNYVIEGPSPHVLDIVFGPPDSTMRYECAETGPRSIGDWDTWVIDRSIRDAMIPRAPIRGNAFEVVDFSMVHDLSGTYMRVGEPFVWSSRFFNGLKPSEFTEVLG